MDGKKLLAARAANLNAAPPTDEKQPACAGAELTFWELTDRPVRALHRQDEGGGFARCIGRTSMGHVQSRDFKNELKRGRKKGPMRPFDNAF
jgi:hypothetical protein